MNTEETTTHGDESSRPARGSGRKWLVGGIGLVVVAAAVAGVLIAVNNGGGDGGGTAAADGPPRFGFDGFGKLKPGMSKDEAVATGELGPSPVSVVTGCEDYSFAGGPLPDPAEIAKDAELEKSYQDARAKSDALNKAADAGPGKNAGAKQFAESAQRYADSAAAIAEVTKISEQQSNRSAARIERSNAAGGVSFGGGVLRLLSAPPGITTPEGIGRESTVDQLLAAYQPKGLKLESEGRYEMAVPGHPGWVADFDTKAGKVTNFLVRSTEIRCKQPK
ncbi:hypothetical protein [Amycolatopsis sp. CA-230715]|uniref:hypothetical protein n=1 Tax=Amycolatopsis sp. CA-230715 TaxID=2745196 RepID=UPI001C022F45|nr:hypothetical protein [Amycolatopsis sp. CA-230715]